VKELEEINSLFNQDADEADGRRRFSSSLKKVFIIDLFLFWFFFFGRVAVLRLASCCVNRKVCALAARLRCDA
jgi:hypothetical protein